MYDADAMIPFKGRLISQEAIFHRVKGMGWNTKTFGTLTEDQMIEVLENRKTPAQMGVNTATVFVPNDAKKIDLDSEEGSVPEVMGAPGARSPDEPPPPVAGAVLESGVAAVAVAPPSHAGKHLRPVDPTKPNNPIQPATPLPIPSQPMMRDPVKLLEIVVKPPRTDTNKLMSMMDAAFQLAQNENTIQTAKTLIMTNGLERAFQTIYPDLAKKVLGRLDTTPDSKCRGGTVLDIEYEAEAGYIHIITTAGTITITGLNLIHKGA